MPITKVCFDWWKRNVGKKVNIKIVTAENFDASLRIGDVLIKEVIANHVVLCNPDLFVTILWG